MPFKWEVSGLWGLAVHLPPPPPPANTSKKPGTSIRHEVAGCFPVYTPAALRALCTRPAPRYQGCCAFVATSCIRRTSLHSSTTTTHDERRRWPCQAALCRRVIDASRALSSLSDREVGPYKRRFDGRRQIYARTAWRRPLRTGIRYVLVLFLASASFCFMWFLRFLL